MESDRQKIDPAMLASSVTECLLPKFEIGLLYAYGISESMCRGWTRTILHTLANTAGMNKAQIGNMSIEAFCLLAGIPDVGLRMQTLRITEFFLLINSHNCVSGKTTLARLCTYTSITHSNRTSATKPVPQGHQDQPQEEKSPRGYCQDDEKTRTSRNNDLEALWKRFCSTCSI